MLLVEQTLLMRVSVYDKIDPGKVSPGVLYVVNHVKPVSGYLKFDILRNILCSALIGVSPDKVCLRKRAYPVKYIPGSDIPTVKDIITVLYLSLCLRTKKRVRI